MDSVDRATLIDFALGRLNDAEAAALARRAERDSEFAQTLAALRQELESLDRVRSDALSAFPRPLSRADRAATFENAASAPSLAESAVPVDERDVFFDAPALEAVKVRRVGPAYPYYNDDAFEEAQDGETAQVDQEAQDGETAQVGQEAQDGETPQVDQEAQDGETPQVDQETQDGETPQVDQEAQDGETAQVDQETQDGETPQVDQEAQDGETPQVDQEAQDGETAQIDQEAQDGETPQVDQEAQDGEDGASSDEETFAKPRRGKRFDFIPKFIAAPSSRRSTFVAKKARFLATNATAETLDPSSFANATAESGESETFAPQTLQENVAEAEVRVDRPQAVADFQDEIAAEEEENALDAASQEAQRDEIQEVDARQENVAETGVRVDRSANVAAFQSENVETRRLAALLGREPTAAEREEYYWETVSDESQSASPSPKTRGSVFQKVGRLATEPTIAIGRATLAFCGIERRTALGADAFAATKPNRNRRRPTGQVSDMMISTVSGILIAVLVVFPLMRLAVKEVFTTIAKSAVHKIGTNVAISRNAPQSDLLPFISEQLVFPRYETANPQGVGAETPLETGTRSETLLPNGVDDPAATPPTLAPAPFDAADAADAAPLPDTFLPTAL